MRGPFSTPITPLPGSLFHADPQRKAKAAGKYRGRPASIDPARVKALRDTGMGAAQIAREMNIGRASVYRALAA